MIGASRRRRSGRSRGRGRRLAVVAVVAAGIVALIGWAHHVPAELNEEDAQYIRLILAENNAPAEIGVSLGTFQDEIDAILSVQDAILSHAPEDVGLPLNMAREPRALYEARKGLCYDRSRAIEKALKLFGFETRHVAIYSTVETGSTLVTLATPRIPSHAVSEVLTSRGWLVVDPNVRWIGLTDDGRPVGTTELRLAASGTVDQQWSDRNRGAMHPILGRPFTYVIGLYSRHGRFYPPYTPVPDINYAQFLQNFI